MVNKTILKTGDVLSEVNHYQVQSVDQQRNVAVCIRRENGKEVEINLDQIQDQMSSADQFTTTVKVTMKDSRSGAKGIRSIFANIPAGDVFTVTFKEQDEKKSKAVYEAEVDKHYNEVSSRILAVQSSKKGVTKKALSEIKTLIQNPVLKVIPGAIRTLKGYKESESCKDGDGLYLVRDMEIEDQTKNYRNINVREIESLIYNGIKYEVIKK